MTGKHPARVGITDWIGGADRRMLLPPPNQPYLPLEEVTIGEAFQHAGYVTGYAGKWHLGTDAYMPAGQGFAESIGVNDAGQPASFFFPYRRAEPAPQDVPDLEDGKEGDYLTDRLTDVAVEFMARHQAEPFFFVLSHYSVHTPIQAPDDITAKYREKAGGPPDTSDAGFEVEGDASTKLKQDHATYAAMVETTDRSVGRLLDQLEALGLADHTAVVFLSDNGGLSTLLRRGPGTPTSNVPLRAGKGWLYEGGIRAPLIVRWRGVASPGAVIAGAASSTDLYPTLLAMAGLPAMPGQHLDGQSLAPVLQGATPAEDRAMFWHFPHYHGSGNTPTGAVRQGPYKLIEWFEDGRRELYRLDQDLSERTNLAESEPERVQALHDLLRQWRTDVGARMPSANPDWNGGRDR